MLPLIFSSVCAVILAVTTYHPYQKHLQLHQVVSDAQRSTFLHTDLNLQNCEPVFPRASNQPAHKAEPSYCDDVVLDHPSGMAYMSCDPTRFGWDAREGIWDDSLISNEQSRQRIYEENGTPAIWAWDTRKESLPRKLYISLPPKDSNIEAPQDLLTSFHPLGLAVTVSHPYYNDEKFRDTQPDLPALLMFVANHPKAYASGVVDVFIHDLDKVGGRDNSVLRWIKRVEGEELKSWVDFYEESEEKLDVNPIRLGIFSEQFSSLMNRDDLKPVYRLDPNQVAGKMGEEGMAKTYLSVPSFFFTSLPSRTSQSTDKNQISSSVYESYLSYVMSAFGLSKSKQNKRGIQDQVFLHHSSVGKTIPTRMEGITNTWQGFPNLLQVWDGNGEKGGSNSSASSVFVTSIDTSMSKVQQWEQHWVRTVSAGIKVHHLPVSQETNDQGGQNQDKSEKEGLAVRITNTYTPSFVSFFDKSLDFPIRALAIDKLGRFWTSANPDTLSVEKWIASQRNEWRRKVGFVHSNEKESSALHNQETFSSIPRPSTVITQNTWNYRHLGKVFSHPWQLNLIKRIKNDGIYMRKEFHGFTIFQSKQESWKEIETRSKQDSLNRGFLPTVPTAIAVDHERGFLIVVGAYEERGIAKCTIPQDWAEK